MGTVHHYALFDRDFFDPVWRLKWSEFLFHYPSRWARQRRFEASDSGPGPYDGHSLRGLIAFALQSKPSHAEVEEILLRRSVRWTIQNASSPVGFLSELLARGFPASKPRCSISLECDPASLLSTAESAFAKGWILEATVRPVMLLHHSERLGVSQNQAQIYRWLRTDGETGDRSSGLTPAETQSFLSFVQRAWEARWPCARDSEAPASFRDFPLHRALFRATQKTAKWKNQCLLRAPG